MNENNNIDLRKDVSSERDADSDAALFVSAEQSREQQHQLAD